MPVKKHDWLKYKEDYFNSEIDEIKHFFSTFYTHVPPDSYKRQTQGWTEEKQAFKKQQAEAARAKMANDPDVQEQVKFLLTAKNNIVKKVALLLGSIETAILPHQLNQVKIGYDMIKTELGEATSITDNKNTNTHEFGEDMKAFLKGLYD